MHHFMPIAEPTYGVMRKAAFLQALDTWSKCDPKDFDRVAPPIDALSDETCDENAELASVFFRLCQQDVLTDQMSLLAVEVLVHERRLDLAWDRARGERDPRYRNASRSDYFNLKPYEAMIGVLRDWMEALHTRSCEVRRP